MSAGRTRILILGAGPAQLPLVKRAKARGLHVTVVAGAAGEPALAHADRARVLDLRDEEALVALARQIEPHAVATTGTDVPVRALGRLVAEFGLPGPSLSATRLCTDKLAMKRRFHECGVPCARSRAVRTRAQAERALAQLGLPAFLKIAEGSGSRGLTRIDSAGQLDAAWEYARRSSRTSELLLEAYLPGPEAGVTALVWNGALRWCLPYNDTSTRGPHPTPIGHSLPFQFPALAAQIESLMALAVRALGIDDCMLNADLILTPQGPRMLEIAVRLGATCMPELMAFHTGVDPFDCVIDLALGLRPVLMLPPRSAPCAALLLRAPGSGQLRQLTVPDHVRQDPALLALEWDKRCGDRVRSFRSGQDRIGALMVAAPSWQQAQAHCAHLACQLTVELVPEAADAPACASV
jgi:biotin carboxylase